MRMWACEASFSASPPDGCCFDAFDAMYRIHTQTQRMCTYLQWKMKEKWREWPGAFMVRTIYMVDMLLSLQQCIGTSAAKIYSNKKIRVEFVADKQKKNPSRQKLSTIERRSWIYFIAIRAEHVVSFMVLKINDNASVLLCALCSKIYIYRIFSSLPSSLLVRCAHIRGVCCVHVHNFILPYSGEIPHAGPWRGRERL